MHAEAFKGVRADTAQLPTREEAYRGTSLIKNSGRPGPYRRTMPMAVLGGWAVSYERGTPVVPGVDAVVRCALEGEPPSWY